MLLFKLFLEPVAIMRRLESFAAARTGLVHQEAPSKPLRMSLRHRNIWTTC